MKLVMGHVNGVTLDAVHQELVKGCSDIRAAVAYASDRLPLFDPAHCSVPVEFFGRLDGVDPDLLDEILRQGDRITCHLVPRSRNLHAKIIWWRGRGAYVGSANLTDAAWFRNLECGVFYEGDELSAGVGEELSRFFDELKGGPLVRPTKRLVDDLREVIDEQKNASAGSRDKLAALESRASAVVVDRMHVPPTADDLPRAKEILAEVSQRRAEDREWRGPYLAWAYYVRKRFGPRTTDGELAREAGETAQGPVSDRLRIMHSLIELNPDIIVDWLKAAEGCHHRWLHPRSKPRKPVPYGQMLAKVAGAAPEKRQRIYAKLASSPQRAGRGGRPVGAWAL